MSELFQPRHRINMSAKSFLIRTAVFPAIFAAIVLISSPWIIYTAFQELTNPASYAMNNQMTLKHTNSDTSGEREPHIYKQTTHNLEDIIQKFDGAQTVSKMYERNATRAMLKIMWYNRPSWFGRGEEECHKLMGRCFFHNCVITYNKSMLEEADAVVFDATVRTFPQHPPLIPRTGRSPNQIWICYGLESPIHYSNNRYKTLEWRSMFNWTMTYRLDSDIPTPYGILDTNSQPPARNNSEIFRSKTRFAAWVVSHCNANSKRDDYVRLLQKYIPVDIFGKCGTKSCSRTGTECKDNIGKNYKFYLSFENSFCKDYTTEKFFQYFSSDLITIRRGYIDYSSPLPSDIFIDTANFSTIQELATFLKLLAEDEDRFVSFLKSKDRYVLLNNGTSTYCNGLCNICEKLNNLEKYKRSYNDIASWLKNNTCSVASDIR